MTDFWYLFGAMALDNDVFAQIKKVDPKFTRIGLTLSEIAGRGDGCKTLNVKVPAAGYLNGQQTVLMRRTVRNLLATKSATFQNPPMFSLYTAAKLCQALTVSEARLGKVFALVTAAIAAAGTLPSVPYIPGFVTLVGASLIDDGVGTQLDTGDVDLANDLAEILPRGNASEWNAAKAIAGKADFSAARDLLIAGDEWDPHCTQRLTFYPEFKRAAN